MDATQPRAFLVTLSFDSGGPLATNIWMAPDAASAAAMATAAIMRQTKTEANLCGVIVTEIVPSELRELLRMLEGANADGKIVSLVQTTALMSPTQIDKRPFDPALFNRKPDDPEPPEAA